MNSDQIIKKGFFLIFFLSLGNPKNYKAFNIFLPGIVLQHVFHYWDWFFHMQIQSLGQNFICEVTAVSSTNLLAALEEKMKHALTFMFQIFSGLERGIFPPSRSYLEIYFQFTSLKWQPPWASHVLGNICFTFRRGLPRKPLPWTPYLLKVIWYNLFYYQMYLYNHTNEGILGENLENMLTIWMFIGIFNLWDIEFDSCFFKLW